MAKSRWLSNDKKKIYPIDINGHSVKVKYIYKKEYGLQKLVQLGFYCENCDYETFVNYDKLYEADDEKISKVRGWMHGYFYHYDCI